MSDPSFLPSAASVAKACYEKWLPNEALDPALEWDVDSLAGLFHARGEFSIFLGIVPWDQLTGVPNRGHAAISDMLLSRAARAALSANFDTMIERWADNHKKSLQGALTGQEASDFASAHNPLVKFHGCMDRDRTNTVWTKGQLDEAKIKSRVQSCTEWMNLNLPDKHLVVVGFWTDWGYLNSVLANAFTIQTAQSVTVIDPQSDVDLQKKAPDLWAKLTSLSKSFTHVQESADSILDELRLAYSRKWAKQFYACGKAMAEAAGIAMVPTPDVLTVDELYNLRRDAEGVPYTTAATSKSPAGTCGEAAYTHIRLLNAGATQEGAWLKHGGKSIRVITGSGTTLNDLRQRHKEPATLPQPDIVVCAGAKDLGVPAKIVPTGKGASVVSPGAGSARWLTFEQAMGEFGL